MAADDNIESEIRFDYRQVSVGVRDVVRMLGEMENRGSEAFSRFADQAKKGSDALQTLATTSNLDKLASSLQSLSRVSGSLFSGAIGTGADFQTELLRIDSIAKFTPDALERYGDKIRVIGRDLGLGVRPAQAAAAAYEVLSSNFTDAASSQTVLSASLRLANVGNAEVGATTKALAGSLNAYGQSAQSAAQFSDVLFQTVNLGVTTIPELASSLGLVTSAASQAGVSFPELNAAIATTTLRGQSTSSSIEGLRGIITSLISPTDGAKKEMARLGITVNETTLRNDGLLRTLQKIQAANGGQISSLNKIIEGQVGLQTALSLTSDKGALFAANLGKIQQSTGSVEDGLRRMARGAKAAEERFLSASDSLKISATKAFLPLKTAIFDAGSAILTTLDKIPDSIKTLALGAVGLGAAFAGVVGAGALLASTAVALNAQLVAVGINLGTIAAKQVVAIALTTRLAFATGGLSGAMAALSLSMLPVIAALVVIGGATAIAVQTRQIAAMNDELVRADAGIQALGRSVKGVSAGSILNTDVRTLFNQGVDTNTITQRIIEARRGIEEAVAKGDKPLEDRLRKTVVDLINKRTALGEFIEKNTGVSKNQTADEAAAQKKANEERFKDELQAIELSNDSHRQKIERLNALRTRYQLDGDDRRRIEREVASETKKEADNQAKYVKNRQEQAKKDRLETLKESLQKIDNGRDPDAVKLENLRRLAEQYRKNGDERRAIEDRIFRIEERQQKQRERNIQILQELRQRALEVELTNSQRRESELDRQQARGLDTEDARRREAEQRRNIARARVQSETAQQLEKTADPAVRRRIQEGANAELAGIDADFSRAVRDNAEAQAEARRKSETDLLRTEQEIAGVRLDLLRQQAERGVDVTRQIRVALEERLRLQEREIELQRQSALAATDDARKRAQAEQQAQAAIIRARTEANNQLRAAEAAEEARKAAKKAAQSGEFTGRSLSLEEFLKGENSRFAGGSIYGRGTIDGLPTTTPSAFQTSQLERKLLDNPSLRPEQVQGAFASAASKAGAVRDTRIDITVRDDRGRALEYKVNSVTLDGKNSRIGTMSRGMDPRGGLGGGL